ncbi:hypothetical protein ACFL14_02940 [Patescibacteria group bacterium]
MARQRCFEKTKKSNILRRLDGLYKQIRKEIKDPQNRKTINASIAFLIFLLIFGVVVNVLRVQQSKIALGSSGDVILLWDTDNGSIPSGWTCISCSGGDAFYGVFPRAASSYGSSTSGSDTHNSHTVTFLMDNPGDIAPGCMENIGSAGPSDDTHTHGTWPAPTLGNGDVRPPYKHLNFIYKNGPTTIPKNVIGIFDNASLPSSWTRYSDLDNNYLRGYSDNATGGSSTHTHTTTQITSPNHTAILSDGGDTDSAAADGHNHTISAGSLDAANNTPPYIEAIFAYNSSGSDIAIPGGLIAMFNTTPPTNWTTVSDHSPWQNNFLIGNTSFGGTGGSSADHNHGVWAPTSDTPSLTDVYSNAGPAMCAAEDHVHDVIYTTGTDGSMPVYRDVILAERNAVITVDVEGTQTSSMSIPSSDQYVGGAFTLIRNTGLSVVTSIEISETGDVDAENDLSNVDIRYETTDTCSYDTGETLFGTAQFDASSNATVTGTMVVSTSQICFYVILDVDDTAGDGDEVEIEITDPSTEVISADTDIEPDTIKAISGTTTLNGNQNPNDPSSLGPASYIDNGWDNDNTPTLNMDCTDPDTGDTVKYRINIDNDSDFSGDLVVDYVSALGSQGTFYFTVGQAEGSGTYYVGSESQTLADSSSGGGYYWRVKCIDDSDAESNWVEAGTDGVIDFKVDATAPTGGVVNDGSGSDDDWNDGSLGVLESNWNSFNFDTSGIDKYEVALTNSAGEYWNTSGSSWGGEYWIDNTQVTTIVINPVYLNTSNLYTFTIRAWDVAGNYADVNSDGIQVLPTLSFTLNTTSVVFDDLNSSNDHWDKKTSTVTTSTNAYNGYSVYTWITQLLTSTAYPSETIPNFGDGTYESPATWPDGQCTSTDCGFGYTSSDTTIGPSKINKFGGGTLWAPFSLTFPGDVLADYVDNIDGETGELNDDTYTITYKVAVLASQTSTDYYNKVTYILTANF